MRDRLDPNADRSIRQLILDTGMPLRTFSEAVGGTAESTLRWWSDQELQLSTGNVESLSQYFGISEEYLFSDSERELLASLVRKRIYQGPTALPDLYANHASSYVRTSAHIVEYLAMTRGRRFSDKLLLNLNIHPLFFDNLDNKINLRFYIDIFNSLSRMGLSDEEISSLACYIFLRLQDTKIGGEFQGARTYQESYSVLAKHATLFESNFEYDFQISSKRIRIIARPTEASVFISKQSTDYYRLLFHYRKKVFCWFPILSNLAPLNLRTVKCLLLGDNMTVYESDLSQAVPAFGLKLLNLP